MARGKAADTFGPGMHASTYGGNPLAVRFGFFLSFVFFVCSGN